MRHMRIEDCQHIEREAGDEPREPDARADIEPASIDVLLHQNAIPLRKARPPASSSSASTTLRTSDAGAMRRIRAPIFAPSITPMIDGTTRIGSTAPRFRYTQAAELSTTESRRPEVATESLSGAPISRLNAGTFA